MWLWTALDGLAREMLLLVLLVLLELLELLLLLLGWQTRRETERIVSHTHRHAHTHIVVHREGMVEVQRMLLLLLLLLTHDIAMILEIKTTKAHILRRDVALRLRLELLKLILMHAARAVVVVLVPVVAASLRLTRTADDTDIQVLRRLDTIHNMPMTNLIFDAILKTAEARPGALRARCIVVHIRGIGGLTLRVGMIDGSLRGGGGFALRGVDAHMLSSPVIAPVVGVGSDAIEGIGQGCDLGGGFSSRGVDVDMLATPMTGPVIGMRRDLVEGICIRRGCDLGGNIAVIASGLDRLMRVNVVVMERRLDLTLVDAIVIESGLVDNLRLTDSDALVLDRDLRLATIVFARSRSRVLALV